jgi:hypothetical protein
LPGSAIDVIKHHSRQAFLRQATGFKVVIDRAGHKNSVGECGRSTQEIEQF